MNPSHPPIATDRQKSPLPFYDCRSCRYADAHGLVALGESLWQALDGMMI